MPAVCGKRLGVPQAEGGWKSDGLLRVSGSIAHHPAHDFLSANRPPLSARSCFWFLSFLCHPASVIFHLSSLPCLPSPVSSAPTKPSAASFTSLASSRKSGSMPRVSCMQISSIISARLSMTGAASILVSNMTNCACGCCRILPRRRTRSSPGPNRRAGRFPRTTSRSGMVS